MRVKLIIRVAALLILTPLLWVLYLISFIFPRRSDIWVFGSYKNLFNDNSKYMFLETALRDENITAIWLSGSNEVVNYVRASRCRAYLRWSPKGVWFSLRAGVHIYSAYLSDTNFWLSGGTRRVNLWHGIPLKKIGRDIDNGKLYWRHHGSLLRRLPYIALTPFYFSVPTRVLAPSDYLGEILTRAMGVDRQAVLDARYPRLDAIIGVSGSDDCYLRLLAREAEHEASLCFRSDDGKRILYAPTWREGDRDFVKKAPIIWSEINDELEAIHARLFIRLHPNSEIPFGFFDKFNRIVCISEINDIYPLLNKFDCLITDYSSIYYDFLLSDKDIIFFPYDFDAYISSGRSLYRDYESMTPGPKVMDHEELRDALKNLGSMDYSSDRSRIRSLVWGGAKHEAREKLKRLLNA